MLELEENRIITTPDFFELIEIKTIDNQEKYWVRLHKDKRFEDKIFSKLELANLRVNIKELECF